MNKYKAVPFEVVEIWYNDIYSPYTLRPLLDKSKKEYAIKIGDTFFQLGSPESSLHICDYECKRDWEDA